MGRLKAALAFAALICTSAAKAEPIDRWAANISLASARLGVPKEWLQVIRMESGGEPFLRGQPVTSRAGDMGLMQLMPATWRDMRAALGLGSDRFGYPGLFAAYNAGRTNTPPSSPAHGRCRPRPGSMSRRL